MTMRIEAKTTRLSAAIILIGVGAALSTQTAVAYDDAGAHQFFVAGSGADTGSSALTSAPVAPPGPARAWAGEDTTRPRHASREVSYHWRGKPSGARSLTVRLHDKAPPKSSVAEVPTKPIAVSIFEDRTLRRGDAVMTANGIRIFAGSSSWPYTAGDFVPLASAKDVSKENVAVLASLDRLPRS